MEAKAPGQRRRKGTGRAFVSLGQRSPPQLSALLRWAGKLANCATSPTTPASPPRLPSPPAVPPASVATSWSGMCSAPVCPWFQRLRGMDTARHSLALVAVRQ
jgi:hypothetical protein